MTRQAIVGAFTIAALLGLFLIFFVLANIGTQGRYKIGVHFKSAAGLHKGALVYESGVNVGLIDSTILRPEDFTVEVIVAVNNGVDIPRNARFIVANPITGDVTLEIVPPRDAERPAGDVAILPHEILPLDQQPQGTNPPTITDLLEQGQGQVQRLDRMLAALETREPQLLDTLQSALRNMNELTANGNERLSHVTAKLDAMMDTLSVALDASSKNIVDLTGGLNQELHKNSGHLDSMAGMLDRTARALNETVDSVRDLATNKDVQKNLIETTQGLAAAQTIGAITADLRRVTSNDQTQGQMRDTVANVDAATQKLNSLLAALGGRSSVYGVDRGATPAPAALPGRPGAAPSAVPGSPGVVIEPQGGPTATPIDASQIRARLGSVARDLIGIQVRISELDKPKPGANSSPVFTSDRGPQTDFNLIVRPHGPAQLMVGANGIGAPGGTTTYNFASIQSLTSQFQAGYGVLYSRLGFLGRYDPGRFSLEGRVYDVRRPTFDAIAGIKLTPKTELFGGERDALRSGRRTEFGMQLQF